MHNLMDENSSLRSLNMSLIYEREKLLRELRQCDTEMVSMQRAVDGLLQSNSSAVKAENNGPLCQVRVPCQRSSHLRAVYLGTQMTRREARRDVSECACARARRCNVAGSPSRCRANVFLYARRGMLSPGPASLWHCADLAAPHRGFAGCATSWCGKHARRRQRVKRFPRTCGRCSRRASTSTMSTNGSARGIATPTKMIPWRLVSPAPWVSPPPHSPLPPRARDPPPVSPCPHVFILALPRPRLHPLSPRFSPYLLAHACCALGVRILSLVRSRLRALSVAALHVCGRFAVR